MTQRTEAGIRKACEEVGIGYGIFKRQVPGTMLHKAVLALARRIEAESAQVEQERANARAVLSDLNAHKDALAQTAEFICRKCGKRQDGPTDNEARF